MNIGERLRTYRKRLGISPERLGMYADVSGAYIRKIESGHITDIRLSMAQKLAHGLGIRVSDFLDRDEMTTLETWPLSALVKELLRRVNELENQK